MLIIFDISISLEEMGPLLVRRPYFLHRPSLLWPTSSEDSSQEMLSLHKCEIALQAFPAQTCAVDSQTLTSAQVLPEGGAKTTVMAGSQQCCVYSHQHAIHKAMPFMQYKSVQGTVFRYLVATCREPSLPCNRRAT